MANKDQIDRNEIVEHLRKVSLAIALINHKHRLNKECLIRDLKYASNIVFPVRILIFIVKKQYFIVKILIVFRSFKCDKRFGKGTKK